MGRKHFWAWCMYVSDIWLKSRGEWKGENPLNMYHSTKKSDFASSSYELCLLK